MAQNRGIHSNNKDEKPAIATITSIANRYPFSGLTTPILNAFSAAYNVIFPPVKPTPPAFRFISTHNTGLYDYPRDLKMLDNRYAIVILGVPHPEYQTEFVSNSATKIYIWDMANITKPTKDHYVIFQHNPNPNTRIYSILNNTRYFICGTDYRTNWNSTTKLLDSKRPEQVIKEFNTNQQYYIHNSECGGWRIYPNPAMLAFLPNKKHFLAFHQGSIGLFDMENNPALPIFTYSADVTLRRTEIAFFSDNEHFLAGASSSSKYDGCYSTYNYRFYIWNINKNKPINFINNHKLFFSSITPEDGNTYIDFSHITSLPNKGQFLADCGGGRIFLYNLHVGQDPIKEFNVPWYPNSCHHCVEVRNIIVLPDEQHFIVNYESGPWLRNLSDSVCVSIDHEDFNTSHYKYRAPRFSILGPDGILHNLKQSHNWAPHDELYPLTMDSYEISCIKNWKRAQLEILKSFNIPNDVIDIIVEYHMNLSFSYPLEFPDKMKIKIEEDDKLISKLLAENTTLFSKHKRKHEGNENQASTMSNLNKRKK